MGARILIVDANATSARLLAYLIRAGGHEVATAGDADAARVRVRARPPHLILMDVQLPGLDGLELTRRLEADPATRELVGIAVTARAAAVAVAAACAAKPIAARALPVKIADHLAGRALGLELDR